MDDRFREAAHGALPAKEAAVKFLLELVKFLVAQANAEARTVVLLLLTCAVVVVMIR